MALDWALMKQLEVSNFLTKLDKTNSRIFNCLVMLKHSPFTSFLQQFKKKRFKGTKFCCPTESKNQSESKKGWDGPLCPSGVECQFLWSFHWWRSSPRQWKWACPVHLWRLGFPGLTPCLYVMEWMEAAPPNFAPKQHTFIDTKDFVGEKAIKLHLSIHSPGPQYPFWDHGVARAWPGYC